MRGLVSWIKKTGWSIFDCKLIPKQDLHVCSCSLLHINVRTCALCFWSCGVFFFSSLFSLFCCLHRSSLDLVYCNMMFHSAERPWLYLDLRASQVRTHCSDKAWEYSFLHVQWCTYQYLKLFCTVGKIMCTALKTRIFVLWKFLSQFKGLISSSCINCSSSKASRSWASSFMLWKYPDISCFCKQACWEANF